MTDDQFRKLLVIARAVEAETNERHGPALPRMVVSGVVLRRATDDDEEEGWYFEVHLTAAVPGSGVGGITRTMHLTIPGDLPFADLVDRFTAKVQLPTPA